MNWQKQLELFQPLEATDAYLFAPAKKVERAILQYNKFLRQFRLKGILPESELKQLSSQFPQFIEANHLYAVLLASRQDWLLASQQLQKLKLMNLSEERRLQVEQQALAVEQVLNQKRRQLMRKQIKTKQLQRVNRNIALGQLLEKASTYKPRKTSLRLATKQEREEAERRSRRLGDQLRLAGEERVREKELNRKFTVIGVLVVAVLFLLFYAIVRPSIMQRDRDYQEYLQRVSWLEEQLQNSADPAVQNIYQAYGQKFSGNAITGKEDATHTTKVSEAVATSSPSTQVSAATTKH